MAGDWIVIPGYKGYEANSSGEIRSVDRHVKGRHGTMFKKGRVLTQHKGTGGYLFVTLSIDNKKYRLRTHVAIAKTFIGERPKNHDVDHIDHNKENNSVWNLRYAPSSLNRGILRAKN